MDRTRLCSLAASLLALLTACGKVSSPGDGDGDNEPPVAMPAELSTYMSTPIVGQLEAEDPDGNPLTFAVVTEPAGGTLELEEDGSFRYLPDHGVSGADAFSFAVDDGTATSDEAMVDVSIATLTDGTPDMTFGTDGAVQSDLGVATRLHGVAIQPDGRVVAVGMTDSEWALVTGYSTEGDPLSPWGESGGSTMLNLGAGQDNFNGVVQQGNSRLVSAGSTQELEGGERDVMLLGLDAEGTLDSSFGEGGVTLTDIGGGADDSAASLALLSDGRLLVAGYRTDQASEDFVVARYSEDGLLDETFGDGGFVVVDFVGQNRVADVAVDGDGNIVLVGKAGNDMAIARLSPDGEPDDSFGDGGQVRLDRAGGYDEAVGVAFAGGAIYVGGNTSTVGDESSMVLVKLGPDGGLDTSFGEDGWALAGSANTFANGMLLLPNQSVLLVGAWVEDAGNQAAVARIYLSGEVDPEFGEGGIYHQAFGTENNDMLWDAALQEDGKVVLVGWAENAGLYGLVLRLGW